jgi:hypothetical protein
MTRSRDAAGELADLLWVAPVPHRSPRKHCLYGDKARRCRESSPLPMSPCPHRPFGPFPIGTKVSPPCRFFLRLLRRGCHDKRGSCTRAPRRTRPRESFFIRASVGLPGAAGSSARPVLSHPVRSIRLLAGRAAAAHASLTPSNDSHTIVTLSFASIIRIIRNRLASDFRSIIRPRHLRERTQWQPSANQRRASRFDRAAAG